MHRNCKVLLRFPQSKGGRCRPLVPRGCKSTGEGVPEGCRRHRRALGFPALNWLLLGVGGRTPMGPTPGDRHARAGRALACLCGAHPPAKNRIPVFNYAFELSSLATDGKPLRPQPGPDGGGGWTKGGGYVGWGGSPAREGEMRPHSHRRNPAARGAPPLPPTAQHYAQRLPMLSERSKASPC